MRRVLVVLAAGALWAVTACAGGHAGRNAVTDDSLKRAVAQWAAFPAGRHPRPIVLLDDLPLLTGEAKAANRAELSARLPGDDPGPAMVALPDQEARLSRISAAEAYGAMAARLARTRGEPRPIRITGSRYEEREWATDRGPLSLPTWTFLAEGGGTAAWPALTPDAFWRPGELRSSGSLGVISVDPEGTRLVALMDWPRAGCDGEAPQIEVLRRESEAVVLIGLRETGSRDDDCVQSAFGLLKEQVFELGSPLGGRVVIDPLGNPAHVRRSQG
ncbi:hypothetical protein IL992_35980 [Microbispora sp. NEAU-D428]|uniref:hypothetical protein n=1 Tax=Microbispora sitophila TaxID=2771537 RepID=UPI00186932FE|nr:hypothetical protein [Microbispora sitophila]MBE3014536.1 hypothetical protein [Microbispora sitophila]